MIELLDKFTAKYGFKANYAFDKKTKTYQTEKKCSAIMVYMLYSTYELNVMRVAEIAKCAKGKVYKLSSEVQDDFDHNDSLVYGELFDELLAIMEDGEQKGIIIT